MVIFRSTLCKSLIKWTIGFVMVGLAAAGTRLTALSGGCGMDFCLLFTIFAPEI
jgi:hypothetical protein